MKVAIPDLISPSYFPAIAAVELGFFKQEGIDATLELLYPVTKTYEDLRDGKLDFVGGASHAVLYAFKDWEGAKLLCALAQTLEHLVPPCRAACFELTGPVQGPALFSFGIPVPGLSRRWTMSTHVRRSGAPPGHAGAR